MKQRIITACVGLCVLAVVLAKFDTWALNLAVSVISLLAVGEVLHVIDSGSRTLTGIGLIFSVLIPFSRIAAIRAVLPIIIYAFIVALFCLLLARHEKMHVEESCHDGVHLYPDPAVPVDYHRHPGSPGDWYRASTIQYLP